MKYTIKDPKDVGLIQYQDLNRGNVFMFEPENNILDNVPRVMIGAAGSHGGPLRMVTLATSYIYDEEFCVPRSATVRLYDAELILTRSTQ